MNMKIDDELSKKILSFIPEDMNIFLVGGFLRDKFLKKESYDRDYVLVGENIIQTVRKLSDSLDAHFVMLDEEREIVRVVLKDKINCLDFAKCSGKNIFEDLKNRDFTINALAYNLRQNTLIDTENSVDDLKRGIIRAVDEKNIEDDPLRVLRAYRFASQLGYEISNETINILVRYKHLLKHISNERINAELMKLFEGEKSADVISQMKNSGVLFEILPELKQQMDVPPNLHHHLWLIDHSIETLRQIEEHFSSQPDFVKAHLLEPFGSTSRYSYLKLSALLHDLGKPSTWTIEEGTGRHRFIKHDEIGSQMAKPILRRLKFGNAQISYVMKLIKHHIYPSQLIKSDTSDKAINRMYRRLDNETIDVILLAEADRLSARGVEITQDVVDNNISGLKKLLKGYQEFKKNQKPVEKLLSGTEIMEIFGVKQSPKLGELINSLKEAQLDGDVVTKDDALEYIKSLL